jgi:hypothetical protein
MHALPTRTKVMLLQLLWLQVLMQLAASDMVVSLRDLPRKEASIHKTHNHATSERRSRRRLVEEPMVGRDDRQRLYTGVGRGLSCVNENSKHSRERCERSATVWSAT